MLYVTTREKNDIFTSYHTLCKDRGPCGGFYIPFRDIQYSAKEINGLKDKTFGQCIAEILNQFFSARLDGWDVDFCIGRRPVKLTAMSHKILIAECWNNPEWDFARTVRNLRGRILGTQDNTDSPSDWIRIVVRIALLFGMIGELERFGIVDSNHPIDVSVCAGDFSAPMAVWYAREMGLPIGKIIFACNENSGPWDLIHHGEIHCNAPVFHTATVNCDTAVPADLERMIHASLGERECKRYISVLERKGLYTLDDEQLDNLQAGMFGAVVSQKRMTSVIRNVFRTSTYILDPYTALAFGGLQDYRATHTDANPALILSEQGPMCYLDVVSDAMGIPMEELKERIGYS